MTSPSQSPNANVILKGSAWNSLLKLFSRVSDLENQVTSLQGRLDQLETVIVFPAMIIGARPLENLDMIEQANRFEYSFVEAIFRRVSDFTWVPLINGRTSTVMGDEFGAPAYNSVEANNDGSGVEAPGYDFSLDILTGFSIGMIDGMPVVPMFALAGDDGDVRYWFSLANPVVGECPR